MTDAPKFRCAQCGAGHAYAQIGRCLFCDGALEPVDQTPTPTPTPRSRRRSRPLRADRTPTDRGAPDEEASP
jgi:hypothetical protein